MNKKRVKFWIILSTVFLLAMYFLISVNADSIFIDYGGSEETGGSSGGYEEGFFGSEEAPPEIPSQPSSGGGVPLKGFTIDKNLIHIKIKQGETKRELLEIINTGHYDLDINITPEEHLRKLMLISEEYFSLFSGKSKVIFIDFFAKENEIPDAYAGRIFVEGDGVKKVINVIIEVTEKEPLFDLIVNVLPEKVGRGKNVKANIKILNLGDLENVDVFLHYSIRDLEGNELTFKEESIAIVDKLDITRELKVPEDVPFGKYMFYTKVSYNDVTAVSTDLFEVVEKPPITGSDIFGKLIFYLILIILTLGVSIVIVLIVRHFKEE